MACVKDDAIGCSGVMDTTTRRDYDRAPQLTENISEAELGEDEGNLPEPAPLYGGRST
jgi:hypothetical protein